MSVSPPATTRGVLRRVSVLLGQSLACPDLVLDAFAGWISSDVQDDALASLVDECKLHKRAVSQRPDTELVFKGLGVAKRYCRRDSIGDSFFNAVREPVIQALRREGTPHHHNPAPDGKHN